MKLVQGRPVQLHFAKRKQANKSKAHSGQDGGEVGGVLEGVETSDDDNDDYESQTAKTNGGGVRKHRAKSERSTAKYNIGRVVVLSNLPEDGKGRRIRHRCEKYGDVEDVTYPISSDQPSVAHVTFSSHKCARFAVEDLRGSKYKKTSEEVLSAVLLSKENKSVSAKTLNKSRVLVRNISFKCDEEDIKEVFEKFGDIQNVHIPRKQNGYMLG